MDSSGWGSQAGHAHGKVTDEGSLGDLHIEGHFLGLVGAVDHLAGDDSVGEARGDFAVDFQAPDDHAVDSLKRDVRARWPGMGASEPVRGLVLYWRQHPVLTDTRRLRNKPDLPGRPICSLCLRPSTWGRGRVGSPHLQETGVPRPRALTEGHPPGDGEIAAVIAAPPQTPVRRLTHCVHSLSLL